VLADEDVVEVAEEMVKDKYRVRTRRSKGWWRRGDVLHTTILKLI
jgi:hypothetical protein